MVCAHHDNLNNSIKDNKILLKGQPCVWTDWVKIEPEERRKWEENTNKNNYIGKLFIQNLLFMKTALIFV